MQKISNVNLSVAIGDYTGSNIENWVDGEEHLLKLNLKDVEMLPAKKDKKDAKTYNLKILEGCQNDGEAKRAFKYVLGVRDNPLDSYGVSRFTDDTMFTFALMHVLVLYREKYGLDKEFDPENFKKYLEELLIDYTEMLLQYYKCYSSIAVLGPMMRKLWDNYLKGIPKNKLKERISVLKSNPDKIVSKKDNEKKFYCKSWANGAAMHVSPVAFAARCMEELDFMIEQTTKNTHDHPESIKGAKCVGQFIFLGRINWSKESIKRWIQYKFSTNEYLPDEYISGRKIEAIQGKYDMNITLEEIRKKYKRELRCKYTVTPALIAVLEANSFKEAVDNARSIGGDCDTICAIAAQMAATLWPINQEYTKTVKEYMLDIETKEQINLDNVNGEKRVILCRNTKGKNVLFQNINDEYEKNFGGYYRDSAPIEWQLKNTLSIVKDLHNDIKNIARDEKKQYLVDLVNSIKGDLKQFQNKANDEKANNLLKEINNEILNLETEIQNLNVKDNCHKGRISTPEGFYKAPKVVNEKNSNKKDKIENKNPSTDSKNPKQVINAVTTATNDNSNGRTEQKIQTEIIVDEKCIIKPLNESNQDQNINCLQFLIYKRTKLFIFSLTGFILGTLLSVYFAINLMWLYFAIALIITGSIIFFVSKKAIEFKSEKKNKGSFLDLDSVKLKADGKDEINKYKGDKDRQPNERDDNIKNKVQ